MSDERELLRRTTDLVADFLDATNTVLARAQETGEAWMGGTAWDGRAAIRLSVSGWRTTEADIDRTVAAFASAPAPV